MSVRLIVLFGWGCASNAEIYQQALTAPDFDEARSLCSKLADLRDPCLLQTFDRFSRTVAGDCDSVGSGSGDECRFLYAERQARVGNAQEAIRACATTRYSRECSYHLLREAVRPVMAEPPASAAAAFEPWKAMPSARDAERLYWKAYFRERIGQHMVSNPTGCPTATCSHAARETLYSSLNGRSSDPQLCSTIPEVPSAWEPSAAVVEWVDDWTERECRKRGLVPPLRAIPEPP